MTAAIYAALVLLAMLVLGHSYARTPTVSPLGEGARSRPAPQRAVGRAPSPSGRQFEETARPLDYPVAA